MSVWVADCEADGLLDEATKMHCFVISELNSDVFTVYVEDQIEELKKKLSSIDVLVGHNFFGYDLPMLKKLYGLYYQYDQIGGNPCKIIDSLALSRALNPDRKGGHGLAAWGERFGVPKPEVEDWKNLPLETYIHRCTEDVKINKLLYKKLLEEVAGYEL